MDPATSQDGIGEIGATAGLVWHALDGSEPLSISKLVKAVDAPRDTILQAIGWLAREGKVELKIAKRSRLVSLK